MAVGAQGSSFRLLTKEQTADETLATGNFLQLPCLSFGLGASQDLGTDDLLSANAGRDAGDPYLNSLTVDGSAVVPMDLVNIGYWLKLVLGAPTSTGTTDKSHAFRSGGITLPSWTVEKAFPDAASYDQYLGVKGGGLSFDMAPTGAQNMTVPMMGLNETSAASSIAGTPTYTAAPRFMRPSGAITLNGTTLGRVTAGTVNFSNNMSGLQTIRADSRLEGIETGKSTAGGSLTIRFADNTLAAQAIASTPCALTYSFTITSTKSITFSFPRVFLSRPRKEVNGPGGIDLPVSWQGAFDPVAGYLMQVVLKNAVTAY